MQEEEYFLDSKALSEYDKSDLPFLTEEDEEYQMLIEVTEIEQHKDLYGPTEAMAPVCAEGIRAQNPNITEKELIQRS